MPGGRPDQGEADIRARIDLLASAIRDHDLEAAMSVYAPDVVSFDFEPPLQHLGADAKRRNWVAVFASYERPLGYEVHDLTDRRRRRCGIRPQPQPDQRDDDGRVRDRHVGACHNRIPEDRRHLADHARPGVRCRIDFATGTALRDSPLTPPTRPPRWRI